MTFQALRVLAKGERAQLTPTEFTDVADGQIRIKVEYSCLNYKDALAVTASSPIMRNLPCTAGIDLAGTVEASADSRFSAGDAVLVCGGTIGELLDGGLAEYAQVPADIVVKRPADFSAREAMSYGTAGFTAALALVKLLRNEQSPEAGPIAVSGATGGVGSIATALLSRAGFSVTAVTRKTDAGDYLRGLGASEIFDAGQVEAPKRPMEKALWAGAVDNLGGDMLSWLIATTQPHGNVASIGLASSFKLGTTVMPFILRGVNLLGIHSVEIPNSLRQGTWDHIFSDWRLPDMDRFITDEISLDAVPAACEKLIAGTVTGRYLVKIA